MTPTPTRPSGRHHVVIIGGGFGGLFAAQKFAGADVDVTLIDRTNHHLFQPLLYQVATGVLSSGEIAPTIRQILRKQRNARVIKAEVRDVNVAEKTVTGDLGGKDVVLSYDSLIVAAGASQSYFGNDHFAEFAPGMKSIDDALELRARITGAFERAEITEDPEEKKRLLTFVVVGAVPRLARVFPPILAAMVVGIVAVVLTGGLSRLIAPLCTRKVHLQPELMLLGLKILYDKNR